ncbi:MAG: ParB N-terminal domain-containing protein [Planctomycetes bacterium]|nr:ParB N-terminal domain-containing protein [Planctomycetota bacterium]
MASDPPATSAAGNADIVTIDLPLDSLTPVRKRTAKKAVFSRLEANIRAVGLIEPFLVYQHKGQNFILDGYLRYQVLLQMNTQTVPCIVIDNLDLYTPNRQVSFLSRSQQWKMLSKALEVVDEETLKSALDLRELKKGFTTGQKSALCPEALDRERHGRLSKMACYHLMHVTFDRQREILALADQASDSSTAFMKAQVLMTPVSQRTQGPGKTSPWNRAAETRKKLIDRLTEAERRHDFYQGLYRQYAADLVKLATHVRQLVTIKEIRQFLIDHHAEDLKTFKEIMQQFGGQTEAK